MTRTPCARFADYNPEDESKAVRTPKCSCYPCWDKFFKSNAIKAYTAALAIKNFGAAAVEAVQGTKYVKALITFCKIEEEKGNKII